jgi:hypothetical protein
VLAGTSIAVSADGLADNSMKAGFTWAGISIAFLTLLRNPE